MSGTVELLPHVAVLEPEVRTTVDDEGFFTELLSDRTGLAVRECQEDDVVSAQRLRIRRRQHPIGQGHQVRLQLTQIAAGVRSTCQRTHLDVGVIQQESQHLPSGIAGGAGNGHGEGLHMHDYTLQCMSMRNAVSSCATKLPECRRSPLASATWPD